MQPQPIKRPEERKKTVADHVTIQTTAFTQCANRAAVFPFVDTKCVCARECGPPKLLLPVHCSDGPSIFMAFARCTALMYLVYVSSPIVLVPLMFTLIPLIHFEMRRAITWTCLLPS